MITMISEQNVTIRFKNSLFKLRPQPVATYVNLQVIISFQ